MKRSAAVLFAATIAAASTTACVDSPTEVRVPEAEPAAAHSAELHSADVHRHAATAASWRLPNARKLKLAVQVAAVTARFHAPKQALKAGYAATDECVAAPGVGGMGYHWVNEGLVDPVFDPYRPEAMLYEADRHGRMRLVAVEYIVIDVGQPAPTFAGQPFDVGGTPVPVPHWSLHLWVHKTNPSGLFAPFNPRVSCPAA
jgi:hypothetical protein